jgi:spermidine synthase/MFS family permease
MTGFGTSLGFRLVCVGGIVFLANAALLVLQLLAGRLLAPFVGSSLETWTSVIGSFLAGIALGNAYGGRLVQRGAGRQTLGMVLLMGAGATIGMITCCELLARLGWHRLLPLDFRIPVLAMVLCFPPGFFLSLPTPLAISLSLSDLNRAGRIAGLIFALSTLGSLLGNYLTGFYLIPNLAVNQIIFMTAASLVVLAAASLILLPKSVEKPSELSPTDSQSIPEPMPMRRGYLIVFCCSFAGMTLELTASRMLAQVMGVSIFTWTGVIGVMLAGTALGNTLGGWLGDIMNRSSSTKGRHTLATFLVSASIINVGVLLAFGFMVSAEAFSSWPIQLRVLAWTFALFFPPMFLLGTITPQVIRICLHPDEEAGAIAGKIYAWSTAGAIIGTFATGYVLLARFGMFHTLIGVALLPVLMAFLVTKIWRKPVLLYAVSITVGTVICAGLWLTYAVSGVERESNYYTIRVPINEEPVLRDGREPVEPQMALAGVAGMFNPPKTVITLQLDRLVHSRVKPHDPTYLSYAHEQVHLEILRSIAAVEAQEQRVLVIGGGGYTFPRAARTILPKSVMHVVEIDPAVTAVSYEKLALDPKLNIQSFAMDGRQFITEKAKPGDYDLITLDAVNDLTVPAHLLTKEFNDQAKAALKPDGVYLLTVIDVLNDGQLWKAAVHTLRKSFKHICVLTAEQVNDLEGQRVLVIYACDQPFDEDKLLTVLTTKAVDRPYTYPLAFDYMEEMLDRTPKLVLTDQYAPVDNLMAGVYRQRKEGNVKPAPEK